MNKLTLLRELLRELRTLPKNEVVAIMYWFPLLPDDQIADVCLAIVAYKAYRLPPYNLNKDQMIVFKDFQSLIDRHSAHIRFRNPNNTALKSIPRLIKLLIVETL